MRSSAPVASCGIRDGSEDIEDLDEEKTDPALPPEMTLRNDVAPTMRPCPGENAPESPTLPGSSTVAGIELRSQSERVWRPVGVVSLVVCGIGIAIAIAVIVAVPASSKHQALLAPRPCTTSLPASAGAAMAPSALNTNEVPLEPEPSTVDVEALPLAPSDHSPTTHR